MKRRKGLTFLLLAALIVVTACALVACNGTNDETPDKEEDPKTPQVESITAQTYFDKMREMNSFGGQKIEAGEDLYFRCSADGAFGLRKEGSDDRQFGIGFDLEALLDRTSVDENGALNLKNSAIKLGMRSGSVSVGAVYFFMNDPTHIYADFAGNHLVLSAELEYEGMLLNDLLGKYLGEELTRVYPIDMWMFNFDFSFNGLLDAIVEGTGEGWSAETLANSLLKFMGIEIEDVENTVEDVAEEQSGQLDQLVDALTKSFVATKSGNEYTLSVSADNGISGMIKQLLGIGFAFKMTFEEENGALKDGVKLDFELPDLVTKDGYAPYLQLGVGAIELAPANGKQISLSAAKEQYSGEAALKEEHILDVKGIGAFGEQLRSFKMSTVVRLDLVRPLETNKTALQFDVSYGDKSVIAATFAIGRLAITFDKDFALFGENVFGEAVSMFGDDLYNILADIDAELAAAVANVMFEGGAQGEHSAFKSNFNGLIIDGVPIRKIVDGCVKSAVDMFKEMSSEQETPAKPSEPSDPAEPPTEPTIPDFGDFDFGAFNFAQDMQEKYIPAMRLLLSQISELDDGKFAVHVDNILKLFVDVVNRVEGNSSKDAISMGDVIKDVISAAEQAVDVMVEAGLMSYDAQYPDAHAILDGMAEDILECVEIDGLPDRDGAVMRSAMFAEKLIEDKNGDIPATEYLMFALLNAVKFDASLDLTDGFAMSLALKIYDAEISYSYKFYSLPDVDIVDPSQGVTADNAASGGYVYLTYDGAVEFAGNAGQYLKDLLEGLFEQEQPPSAEQTA